MKKDRSHWTIRKVSFEEAEELDIDYWLTKSIKERMSEATDWIEKVWGMHEQIHGKHQSIPNGKHYKSKVDEDDF